MDLRESWHSIEELIRSSVEARQAEMWTALPGIVESVDFEKQTMTVRPAIKSAIKKPDGTVEHVDLPMVQDVPMHMPGGGGTSITFPVAKGDETLLVFCSRPIDAWHQSGGVQQQTDARMHHLSDAKAIVGFRSQPRKLQNVSSTSTQMRSDDGKHVVDLHPQNGLSMASQKAISMSVTEGGKTSTFAMTGSGIRMTGEHLSHNNMNISGAHVHTNVEPGGGQSGPPTADA